MADKKISALTAASTPLAGTEVLPIVQSGTTVKVAVSDLTAGRAISATQLTLTAGNVIPANGYGIDFSATPGTGTSELLADYEEGTWTPTLTGFTTTGTVTATGRYVLVGKILYLHAEINATGGSITSIAGTSAVRGQPFAAASASGLITQNAGTGVGLGTGSYQGTYMYTPSFGPLTTFVDVDTTCRIS